ncbi:uncharacterized protein LOC112522180 isoform X1 [Cynara cardunculus var. scolymus]|uniref:uncharacterized protein LOC112522180 isoform X1 n=2 Tax=Cynara cardunculus var. scolymus TaxID=59895 RepID=UPI000D62B4B0|nr:uncharacterized protein LOC112522180 isoform X1 [Cynara cardunculus var. scolymus]
MEGKENISQYRDKLDKTLMSPDLSNVESLKILVGNQMSKSLQCEDQEYSDKLVQKRTKEVANFLSMLRSASGSAVEGSKVNEIPQGGWKIKHDNQDCRVMYREGPAGTPFHTLLAEGYVDGPLDVCLCISWEAGLYQKWWPQFNIPAFKVLYSECVKKVRMGEQISLVRMKLSWPLSTREALVHYVTLEYFQDDLIIVLLNTISESENIDKTTHGFTREGIPDVENVTRIDVVGGLALQKVSANRSYFRTIVNMDIKLDFVPPAIINFVSRQLVGSGFKLYKKEVASVSKGDADFSKALKEPFYGRIREALFTDDEVPNGFLKQDDVKIVHDAGLEQKDIKIVDGALEQETAKIVQPKEPCSLEGKEAKYQRSVGEIEEIEETRSHEDDNSNEHPTNKFINDCRVIVGKKQVIVSPEVKQALGTLEKVISVFRELEFNPRSLSLSRFTNNVFAELEDHKTNGSKRFVAASNEFTARTSQESRNSFSGHSSRQEGCATETQDDEDELKIASQEHETLSSRGSHRSSFSFAINEAITLTQNNTMNGEVKNSDESQKKMKKQRFCCLNFTSGRGFS